MDISERIGSILEEREQKATTKPDGTKREPVHKREITWIPLYKRGCEDIPKGMEEVEESKERFLATFEAALSLLQQAIYEGKKKSFAGSAGKIVSVLIDAYANGEMFPEWPEEAVLDPMTYYILDGTYEWEKETENKYLPMLQQLGVLGIDYPEFEESEESEESEETE